MKKLIFFVLTIFLTVLFSAVHADDVLVQHKDITVSKTANRLIIKNSRLQRIFDLSLNAPKTVSLQNSKGEEFASANKQDADFSFIGLGLPSQKGLFNWSLDEVTAEVCPANIYNSECVRVRLKMSESYQKTSYIRDYFIYPDFPALSVENYVSSPVKPHMYWSPRTYWHTGQTSDKNAFKHESCVDSITLKKDITPKKSAVFYAITDGFDKRVEIVSAVGKSRINGNILSCYDNNGKGIVILQEAPPSNERRDYESYDFRYMNGTLYSCNWGIFPSEIVPDKLFKGYRNAMIVVDSAADEAKLIKQYLRLRYPFDVERHASIMVNPWGVGNYYKLVNEQFLLDEIKAVPDFGATHYQIDDAWQTGAGLGELSNRNRKITPDFWTISQRKLKGSLQSCADMAAKNNVKLGLWIAPSANSDFDDWEVMKNMLLDYHRKYNIEMFKVDFVKMRTYTAQENLIKLLSSMRDESNGKIYFNLDVTNGQRSGYFYMQQYGNIFLENRYVSVKTYATVTYHPEKALRSLWELSQYIRPQVLQIEIPSPEEVNPENYKGKNFVSLENYPVEYWSAIPLFASPLLWLSPSKTSPEMRGRFKTIMDLHKSLQKELHESEVFAIGSKPNGKAITGFHAHNFNTGNGMVILFREYGSQNKEAVVNLQYLPANCKWEKLYGSGEVQSIGNSAIKAVLNEKASFMVVKYSK
ncbi:MAG: hypothetical protein IJW31_00230 [Lentisphaeria bacterium]|nr:hypothetical protein [Lentisphaeria bacterium]